MKVGILGGGLSGLALAANLKRHSFEVLEAGSECGGLCRTTIDQGYTFDYGGAHIIFSRDQKILGYMLSLLGDNVVQSRRNTKVLYNGRLVKYPFENGLSGLPPGENLECLLGYAKALAKGKGNPKNLKDWLIARFGKGIAEKYLIPYNEKIWNLPAAELGTSWVEGRVPQPPFLDVLKASLGMGSEGYTHQLNFYYPREFGIQSLTLALENKARDRITRNFTVKKVRKEGRKWVVSDGKTEKEFDTLVSTIPIHSLAAAIGGIPKGVRQSIAGLKFNSVATVMLGINTPKLNSISWMYFPGSEPFNRVAFPSNFSPRAAPVGKSSAVAEATYREGDEISRMSDRKLLEETVSALHGDKLINKSFIGHAAVRRAKYAYVLHDLDYEENSAAARDYFKHLGIHLCGRFSEFRYLNMDACISSAMKKAAELERRKTI